MTVFDQSKTPRVISIGADEVTIDPTRLEFNEATLSEFIENIALWCDHYGQKLADAEHHLWKMEKKYDVKYSEKYELHKENGCTDKLSEAKAKCEVEVEAAKDVALDAKYAVSSLKRHLNSWDKVHEASQNRGHTLRKELDKLNTDIYRKTQELGS